MAFITAQNTLSTFLTFWHLFYVQRVKFPFQVSRRKFYDVKLVLSSLRRKIQQRLFYGEKSTVYFEGRLQVYAVIKVNVTRYVVIIISYLREITT